VGKKVVVRVRNLIIMESLKAPSRLTNRKSNRLELRNKKNVLSIIDVDVSSETLDNFFKGVFNSLGLEVGASYKISELITKFEDKKIQITAVRGIKYPGDVNTVLKDFLDKESSFTRMVVKNTLFGGDSETKENFDKILECMDFEFVLDKTRVLPSFTQFNQSFSIKDRYVVTIYGTSSDGSMVDVPVISVELS